MSKSFFIDYYDMKYINWSFCIEANFFVLFKYFEYLRITGQGTELEKRKTEQKLIFISASVPWKMVVLLNTIDFEWFNETGKVDPD